MRNRGKIRELYRTINSICSPFDSPDAFKATFEIDNIKWLEEMFFGKILKKMLFFNLILKLKVKI